MKDANIVAFITDEGDVLCLDCAQVDRVNAAYPVFAEYAWAYFPYCIKCGRLIADTIAHSEEEHEAYTTALGCGICQGYATG